MNFLKSEDIFQYIQTGFTDNILNINIEVSTYNNIINLFNICDELLRK